MEHSRRAAARAKKQSREIKMATLEEQQRTHIEQLRCKIQRKVNFLTYIFVQFPIIHLFTFYEFESTSVINSTNPFGISCITP